MCVLRPPPPSEWLSSRVISGQPLALSLGVAWGINEVVAHRSICYALLMKYKDMVLLTLLPLTPPPPPDMLRRQDCFWFPGVWSLMVTKWTFQSAKVHSSQYHVPSATQLCLFLRQFIWISLMQRGSITENERMSCRHQNIRQGWKLIYFKVSENIQLFRRWTAWYIHKSK